MSPSLLPAGEDQGHQWQDTEGNTAAIFAVMYNCTEAVKILSEIESIDWNIVGEDEDTALTWALDMDEENADILRILFGIPSLDINIDKLKDKRAYEKAVIAAKKYLDSLMDNSGDDYLMFALKTDLDKIAALLISHVDTNLDTVDDTGDTPLSFCLKHKKSALANELLRKGSNVSINNVEEKEENGAECPVKLKLIHLLPRSVTIQESRW